MMSDPDHLQRQINDLRARSDAPYNKVVARYTASDGQTIPDSTATIINYSTKATDTHGLVTTGVAWKFTAPRFMYVNVTASAIFLASASWTTYGVISLTLYRNGVARSILDYVNTHITAGAVELHWGVFGSDIQTLTAGEYIDVRLTHNFGGDLALHGVATNNHISIFEI